MTAANYKEAHPTVDRNPNLLGHQQKFAGPKVRQSLPDRTNEFAERFFSNKDKLVKNLLGHIVFDIPEEMVPRKPKNRSR